ncbi:MAG TPA: hypothetical protein VGQ20_05950 [Acidimicrobiales bacterium]|nr:hypothetical protein [Acidimicrobiales bacterium]
MRLTVWTYPWDVARLGADTVLGDLAARGLQGIDLAATYHPISALSPRGETVRGFFCPSGAVFFPARAGRYGRVRPQVWPDRDIVDAWAQVASRVGDHGLELNAWTIVLFQPWLAQAYPDLARVYATGNRLDSGVCPSHPDLHEYLRALVCDMTDQFPVGLVKLEGVHPPAFDYGWTRRRIYFDLTPEQQRLMALCFCDACTAAGRQVGIDVESVRRQVVAALHHDASPSDTRSAGDELDAYAGVGPAAAASLVHALAAALRDSDSSARLAVASPLEGGGAGLPIESIVDDVGVVLLANVRGDLDAVRRAARVLTARRPRPSLEYFLHPPLTTTGGGGIPHGIHEDLADPAWREDLQTAVQLGADRISLYNYGLLTEATFDRLVKIARSAG